MSTQPISYRLNPQLPSKPPVGIAPDQPENLYKPPLTALKRTVVLVSPDVAPALLNRQLPLRNHIRPRQLSAIEQSQQAEAQEIAQRVQDTSQSNRLEYLLDRHQNKKRYDPSASYRQPSMELEHLAVAKRPDRRYQIILRGTKESVSRHVFTTLEHCAETAAELEQRFVLGPVLGAEVAEAVDGIVRAAVARELVQRWCAVA